MTLWLICFLMVYFIFAACSSTKGSLSHMSAEQKRIELYKMTDAYKMELYKQANPERWQEQEDMRYRFELMMKEMSFMRKEALYKQLYNESWQRILELTGQTGEEWRLRCTGHELRPYDSKAYHEASMASTTEKVYDPKTNQFTRKDCVAESGMKPHNYAIHRAYRQYFRKWAKETWGVEMDHEYLSLLKMRSMHWFSRPTDIFSINDDKGWVTENGTFGGRVTIHSSNQEDAEAFEREYYEKYNLPELIPEITNY